MEGNLEEASIGDAVTESSDKENHEKKHDKGEAKETVC